MSVIHIVEDAIVTYTQAVFPDTSHKLDTSTRTRVVSQILQAYQNALIDSTLEIVQVFPGWRAEDHSVRAARRAA
jgi:hypothetical protein